MKKISKLLVYLFFTVVVSTSTTGGVSTELSGLIKFVGVYKKDSIPSKYLLAPYKTDIKYDKIDYTIIKEVK